MHAANASPGPEPSGVRRLKGLKAEKARLKQRNPDRDLEVDAIRAVVRRKW